MDNLILLRNSGPDNRVIDADAARRLLAGTARLLKYAAESADLRELAAGIDLLRKVGLEIRN